MSNTAINWAYKQPVKVSGEKFVLVALADFADSEGSCFPSQQTLADMTGQSRSSVNRHMKNLESVGLVKRERRVDKAGYRMTDRFYLQIPMSHPATLDPEPMSHPAPPMSHDLRRNMRQELKNLRTLTEPSGSPFAQFWQTYPKRVNRKAAKAKWDTVIKSGVTTDQLLEGARRYAEHVRGERTEPRYVKAPDVWLNKGCWEDEYGGHDSGTLDIDAVLGPDTWCLPPMPADLDVDDHRAVHEWRLRVRAEHEALRLAEYERRRAG